MLMPSLARLMTSTYPITLGDMLQDMAHIYKICTKTKLKYWRKMETPRCFQLFWITSAMLQCLIIGWAFVITVDQCVFVSGDLSRKRENLEFGGLGDP